MISGCSGRASTRVSTLGPSQILTCGGCCRSICEAFVVAVIFFSPFIFQSMGDKFKGETGSLIATVIVGAVQVLSPPPQPAYWNGRHLCLCELGSVMWAWTQEVGTILGMLIVDRVGRRKMLIQSTIQSLVAQLVLAIVFAVSTDSSTVMMGAVPARASIILVSSPVGESKDSSAVRTSRVGEGPPFMHNTSIGRVRLVRLDRVISAFWGVKSGWLSRQHIEIALLLGKIWSRQNIARSAADFASGWRNGQKVRGLMSAVCLQICIFVFSYGYGWGPMGEHTSLNPRLPHSGAAVPLCRETSCGSYRADSSRTTRFSLGSGNDIPIGLGVFRGKQMSRRLCHRVGHQL